MKTFLRRTFSITQKQMIYLKERADALGISIADVFRRIIDEHMENK